MRASSADNTTSNYNTQALRSFDTTTSSTEFLSQNYSYIGGGIQASATLRLAIDVDSPFMSANTLTAAVLSGFNAATTYMLAFSGGTFNSTTQFDGFSVYPDDGTITGTVRVYGYLNS
jgi:hypothetical protein